MPAYVYLMLLLCSYAVVEVEVRNRGEESFKPDIYGDSIIIERRINQSSSTTVLKDHQGLFGFLIKISLIHLKSLEFLVILMKKVLRPLGHLGCVWTNHCWMYLYLNPWYAASKQLEFSLTRATWALYIYFVFHYFNFS